MAMGCQPSKRRLLKSLHCLHFSYCRSGQQANPAVPHRWNDSTTQKGSGLQRNESRGGVKLRRQSEPHGKDYCSTTNLNSDHAQAHAAHVRTRLNSHVARGLAHASGYRFGECCVAGNIMLLGACKHTPYSEC